MDNGVTNVCRYMFIMWVLDTKMNDGLLYALVPIWFGNC